MKHKTKKKHKPNKDGLRYYSDGPINFIIMVTTKDLEQFNKYFKDQESK